MEDKYFYKLLNYFSSKIKVEEYRDNILVGGGVPLEGFYAFSMEKASRFIGECNRNIEAYKNKPEFIRQELLNYQEKFAHVYAQEFGADYTKNTVIDLEKYIPPETSLRDELKVAYEGKLSAYSLVFKFLDEFNTEEITSSNKSQHRKSRIKAERFAMILNLNDDQFREIHHQMIHTKLIHESSSITDFINAFSGKRIDNKIIWIGGNYRLSLFIKGLNSEACFKAKIHDGIWDIVSDLFVPGNGAYFVPSALMHASASKGVDYKNIEYIIHDIKDFLSSEL